MDRRLFLALTSASLISLPTTANAGASIDRWDGNWWTGLTDGVKFGYVLGYVEGSDKANSTWVHSKCEALISEKYSAGVSHSNDYSGITFGQLIKGIDEFYKDFRNTRILLTDAMMMVKMQISGVSQEIIDKSMELLRKTALDPNY